MSQGICMTLQPTQFLRHDRAAFLLGDMEVRELLDLVRAGAFGPEVCKRGKFYLIPVEGFNRFVQGGRIFTEAGELKGIHAPARGKLRRS